MSTINSFSLNEAYLNQQKAFQEALTSAHAPAASYGVDSVKFSAVKTLKFGEAQKDEEKPKKTFIGELFKPVPLLLAGAGVAAAAVLSLGTFGLGAPIALGIGGALVAAALFVAYRNSTSEAADGGELADGGGDVKTGGEKISSGPKNIQINLGTLPAIQDEINSLYGESNIPVPFTKLLGSIMSGLDLPNSPENRKTLAKYIESNKSASEVLTSAMVDAATAFSNGKASPNSVTIRKGDAIELVKDLFGAKSVNATILPSDVNRVTAVLRDDELLRDLFKIGNEDPVEVELSKLLDFVAGKSPDTRKKLDAYRGTLGKENKLNPKGNEPYKDADKVNPGDIIELLEGWATRNYELGLAVSSSDKKYSTVERVRRSEEVLTIQLSELYNRKHDSTKGRQDSERLPTVADLKAEFSFDTDESRDLDAMLKAIASKQKKGSKALQFPTLVLDDKGNLPSSSSLRLGSDEARSLISVFWLDRAIKAAGKLIDAERVPVSGYTIASTVAHSRERMHEFYTATGTNSKASYTPDDAKGHIRTYLVSLPGAPKDDLAKVESLLKE
jgi:hypothetical protein